MVAHVRFLVAGQLRGQVALCVVCTMHVEMRSVSFLVEPQSQGRWFVSGLASKPLGQFVKNLDCLSGLVIMTHMHDDFECPSLRNYVDTKSWLGYEQNSYSTY
jgi:hypothetical protein